MSITIVLLTKDSSTLLKCLFFIDATTAPGYDLLIANGGCSLDVEEITKEARGASQTTILDVAHTGPFAHQVNWAISQVKEGFFVCFPDDCLPLQGWLEHAFSDFDRFFKNGMGLLALNDGQEHYGVRASVIFTTKEFVDKHLEGTLINPAFKHYFGDDELPFRVKDQGENLYAFSEKSVILHNHKNNPEEERKHRRDDRITFKRLCFRRELGKVRR